MVLTRTSPSSSTPRSQIRSISSGSTSESQFQDKQLEWATWIDNFCPANGALDAKSTNQSLIFSGSDDLESEVDIKVDDLNFIVIMFVSIPSAT